MHITALQLHNVRAWLILQLYDKQCRVPERYWIYRLSMQAPNTVDYQAPSLWWLSKTLNEPIIAHGNVYKPLAQIVDQILRSLYVYTPPRGVKSGSGEFLSTGIIFVTEAKVNVASEVEAG